MRLVLIGTLTGAAALAQLGGGYEETRRAEVRGGGNGSEGKCTIEVVVDGVAEVELRGDTGRIRTLQGAPARWVRFQCDAPPPARPAEFRFKGIDGRGSQQLVADPRQNGSAVIRITDSKGGEEGYTFDVEWRGGALSGSSFPGSSQGGIFGDTGNARGVATDEINFRGRGDGYARGRRGAELRLEDANVFVTRGGDVDVNFQTSGGEALSLRGRVIRGDGDRIVARVDSRNLGQGDLTIYTQGRNRVTEMTMTSGNAEISWRGGGGRGAADRRDDTGSIFPGADRGGRNRGGQTIDFSSPGSGYLRTSRGEDRITDADVRVNRNGNVNVSFANQSGSRLQLRGRVVSEQSDRVVAEVSGSGVSGEMTLYTDSMGRVSQIQMTGRGFELRWRP